MHATYEYSVYPYRKPPELDGAAKSRHPVIVVGAGPIGLSAAIDLALHQVPVILLDEDNTVSTGSRAICFAKRTLEIFDRLGCGDPMVEKGVTWNLGKVFYKDKQIYSFNLLPESGHERPAFINLQQYYLEDYLVQRAQQLPLIDLRWNNQVTRVQSGSEGVTLTVNTLDGAYTLQCDYLIAADGARSPVRKMLGLESKGQVFRDRFLIADIVMNAEFPTERWFWFDPPFHQGQSTLLHKQPDQVWRIDFQLGWEADPDEEKKPENVIPRVKAMLGDDIDFELEWCSVYTFQCRRMERLRHGRVIFAGDAAHQVSPFGARGANSGIQDVDNLIWKLKLVLDGKAPQSLLDTYQEERSIAADENILNSTRSTDFIAPKGEAAQLFRNVVLELAEHYPFARSLVNSGRLSLPTRVLDSSLNTPDADDFGGGILPGAPAVDAPLASAGRKEWLLRQLGGEFCLLLFDQPDTAVLEQLAQLSHAVIPVRSVQISERAFVDVENLATQRYAARPGTVYLIRPDQYVCARWRHFDVGQIWAAVAKATAQSVPRAFA